MSLISSHRFNMAWIVGHSGVCSRDTHLPHGGNSSDVPTLCISASPDPLEGPCAPAKKWMGGRRREGEKRREGGGRGVFAADPDEYGAADAEEAGIFPSTNNRFDFCQRIVWFPL